MIASVLWIFIAACASDSIRKRAPPKCLDQDLDPFYRSNVYNAFSDNYAGCIAWEMAGKDLCSGEWCKAVVKGVDALVEAAPHCSLPDFEDRTVKDMYSEFAEDFKETWNARCGAVHALPKVSISEICTKFLFGNNE